MLFDHGCDSIGIGTQMYINAKCINVGDNLWSLVSALIVVSIFYCAMLEEYYKGIMVLPPGNGVSDGSFVIILIYIAMGIFGNDWCSYPVTEVNGIELNFARIFLIAVVISQIF